MYTLFRNADKLFVKSTQWRTKIRNSLFSLHYSTTLYREPQISDYPPRFYADNDDVIKWTSKLSSLARINQPREAICLYKKMLGSNLRPNYVTMLSLIKALGAVNCENLLKLVHGSVIKMGFETELYVLTAILGSYSTYDMVSVWRLFDQISAYEDCFVWTAMIAVCVRNKYYIDAIDCFREMQVHCVNANHVSIVSVLPACGGVRSLRLGREIHGFSVKNIFYNHTNVQNSLIVMYSKCNNLESSLQVFDSIQHKDIVSWRIIIRSCVENRNASNALIVFSKMRLLLVELDNFILQDIISALVQAEESKLGPPFHCFVLKGGFSSLISIETALLQMYHKFGDSNSARNLFDNMNQKDVVSWSSMISVYAQCGKSCDAFNTFKEMVLLSNDKPNEFTFVSLVKACSLTEDQTSGESLHAQVIKLGYSSNAHIASALIDLYCRFGKTNQGTAIFDEIPTKDLVCWSSMINGYGLNGYGTEALETFSKMLDLGVKPNAIVFLSVLSACSQHGLEHEGRSWFYSMTEDYGLVPELAHYGCMVDLLSRCGKLEEAFQFVKKMCVAPDKRIWGALLGGCRLNSGGVGSLKIAEIAVEQMRSLDPADMRHCLILLDMYAEECRWDDVDRLRTLIDDQGSQTKDNEIKHG